jgi:hypothetical protein
MGELNADRGTLTLHESDQRLEAFSLRLVPNAEVMLVDQPDLLDPCRLDKDQPKTSQRVAAEMHDVKGAASIAGVGTIMNHRRYDEAVFQRETPDREWLKQHRR